MIPYDTHDSLRGHCKSANWTWAIQDHSTAVDSALCTQWTFLHVSWHSEHNQAKRACTMSFCTGCISRQMFSPACFCFFSIRVSTGTSQFLFFTGVLWGPYTFTGHHTCLSSIFAYVRVLAVEVEAIPTWGVSFIHLKTACPNEISREWIMWRTWWHSICFRKKKHTQKKNLPRAEPPLQSGLSAAPVATYQGRGNGCTSRFMRHANSSIHLLSERFWVVQKSWLTYAKGCK